MIKVISSDFKDNCGAFLKTSSSFKKGATFGTNAEYVVIQDKKILGITFPNTNFSSKNVKLDEKCFKGLKAKGLIFKKVDAGIWCFKKEFKSSTTIQKVYHGISVNFRLSLKFKLIDTQKAYKLVTGAFKDLWVSQNSFRDFFNFIAEDVVSALCKVIADKGGSRISDSNFNTFASVMNKKYQEHGYEVIVGDIIKEALNEIYK